MRNGIIKNLFSLFMALTMLFSMVPLAYAEGGVAQIEGGGTFSSLQTAIDAVEADGVAKSITLLGNTSETVEIKSGQNITLDIKGKTIDGAISIYGSLTIQDSIGNGVIKSVSKKTGGNLTIEGGSFISCPSSLYWPEGYIFIKNDSGVYSLSSLGDNPCYLTSTTATAAIGAFSTIAGAINNISGTSAHNIILCKDVTEDISIPKGIKIILDLSGHTLTGNITNSGTLTVKDSKATSESPNGISNVILADTSAKLIVSKSSTCPVNSKSSAFPDYYISGSGSSSKPYVLTKYSVSITSGESTSYEKTLAQAVATASTKESAQVTLFSNIDLKSSGLTVPAEANITLDLNGHYVKANNITGQNIQVAEGATLTLKDSTDANKDGTGDGYVKYSSSGPDGLIHVNGTFVMESGRISCSVMPYRPGVAVWGNGIVQIHGGKIDAGSYALAGNGSETGTTTITIDGGILSSKSDVAIYHPQKGTMTVSGGTITGAEGIQMCSGTLIIEGSPSITATGTDQLSTKEGDGSLPDGAAISLVSRPGYQELPQATISGTPTVMAASEQQAIRIYTWDAVNKEATVWEGASVSISGGTFSTKPDETYIVDGYEATQSDEKWVVSKPQYTVTFISNEETVDTQAVSWGDSVSAPSNVSKTGYTLEGWYVGETKFNFETGVIKDNTTLTAKWTANTPTVIFNANGGTVRPDNKQVTYDAAYGELPVPEKTGYTFDGWFTDAGAGSQVTASTIVSNPEGHTLYAHWTANSYTVRFDSKGGSACADIPATYDADVTLPAPSKSGYNFNGWNTAEDGNGTSYQGTTSNLASANGAVVTLYAQWTDKAVVTYDNAVLQIVAYDGSAKAYVLPAHDLTGFTVSYKQAEETVVEPTNAGTYDVVITRSEDATYAAFSKTITGGLVIEKATGSIGITPSASRLSGGGKVTLTVTSTGLPTDAVITVTCNNNIIVASDLTAFLPDSSVTYTFTATYTDQTGNYENASASCTVEVSRESYSSSSGSNTSTTTEKNPDGSTTTTTTDKTTGTVTEVTKNTDGTTTTVETKKDGTVTETVKTPEGTTGTVVTDKNGDIAGAKATVSSTAVKEAAKTGEAVTLPVEVPPSTSTKDAPVVQVTVPESVDSVKVEIPVEKVTPGTVAIIVNADGTEEIVSTSVVTETGVVLTLDGSATVKVIDNSKDFIDVPETNVFYNEISSLSAREIMVGKTEDFFDLHNDVTLNQVVNVAGRITGEVDVNDFNAGIVWGNENGLKTGNEAATRGEVLKALYVAAGSPAVADTSIVARFNDAANIPADMEAIVAWAAQNGILKGTDAGNADLNAYVTRGQACALASRTMGTLA